MKGYRAGSVIKSIYCPYRGPGVSSQCPPPGNLGASSAGTYTHVHPYPNKNDNVLHYVSYKVTVFILKTEWSFPWLLFGNFLHYVLQVKLQNGGVENGQHAPLIGNLHEDFLSFSFNKRVIQKSKSGKYIYISNVPTKSVFIQTILTCSFGNMCHYRILINSDQCRKLVQNTQ